MRATYQTAQAMCLGTGSCWMLCQCQNQQTDLWFHLSNVAHERPDPWDKSITHNSCCHCPSSHRPHKINLKIFLSQGWETHSDVRSAREMFNASFQGKCINTFIRSSLGVLWSFMTPMNDKVRARDTVSRFLRPRPIYQHVWSTRLTQNPHEAEQRVARSRSSARNHDCVPMLLLFNVDFFY